MPGGGSRAPTSRGAPGAGGGARVQASGPLVVVQQPLPRVLILHTGGTLGMDVARSYEADPHEEPHHPPVLKRGTGGAYPGALEPGTLLNNLFKQV